MGSALVVDMWHILLALMIMFGTQSAVGKVLEGGSPVSAKPKSAAHSRPSSAAPTIHLHTIDVYMGQHASILSAGVSLRPDATVLDVTTGSSAHSAGILPGDLLLKVSEERVEGQRSRAARLAMAVENPTFTFARLVDVADGPSEAPPSGRNSGGLFIRLLWLLSDTATGMGAALSIDRNLRGGASKSSRRSVVPLHWLTLLMVVVTTLLRGAGLILDFEEPAEMPSSSLGSSPLSVAAWLASLLTFLLSGSILSGTTFTCRVAPRMEAPSLAPPNPPQKNQPKPPPKNHPKLGLLGVKEESLSDKSPPKSVPTDGGLIVRSSGGWYSSGPERLGGMAPPMGSSMGSPMNPPLRSVPPSPPPSPSGVEPLVPGRCGGEARGFPCAAWREDESICIYPRSGSRLYWLDATSLQLVGSAALPVRPLHDHVRFLSHVVMISKYTSHEPHIPMFATDLDKNLDKEPSDKEAFEFDRELARLGRKLAPGDRNLDEVEAFELGERIATAVNELILVGA